MKHRFIALLCLALVETPLLFSAESKPAIAAPASEADLVEEKAVSTRRMTQIYEAIQTYRKDHRDLPKFLSDLHPQYVPDTNTFLCPTFVREGREIPFSDLRDPKLTVHFGYEFNGRPIGGIRSGSSDMTMADWKRMQMMMVGGAVPMLRCFAYDKVLNVNFDGKVVEGQLNWEWDYADLVQPGELDPRGLKLRLMRLIGGEANPEALAFEELRATAAKNTKGVLTGSTPLDEAGLKWNAEIVEFSLATVRAADTFLEKFPASPSAGEADELRELNLMNAIAAGSKEALGRVESMVARKLAHPDLSAQDTLEAKQLALIAFYRSLNNRPQAEMWSAMEPKLRALIQEFPAEEAPYRLLLSLARMAGDATSLAVAKELAALPTVPETVTAQARAQIKQSQLMGGSPEIRFTAVDGREVDLAKLKGKVVLIDYWATWCGPCIAELPHVKEAYQKLHAQGFEVVGISLDSDKKALTQFIQKNDIPWPQHFEGEGEDNRFAKEYGINSIPTTWLVGRDGKVAAMNLRGEIVSRIEELLRKDP